MKRKIFTVESLLYVLAFASIHSTLSTALTESDSESSLNQLSSRTSSSISSNDGFFYHTTNGALPFDREITIYIFSGEAKRMYYQIHNTKPDIALTVTPCESAIEWKLLFIEEKSHKKERKTRPRRRYKRRHNRFVTTNLLNHAKPVLLTSYVGNERRTYSDVSTLRGLYIIDFNSYGKDVSVKLFLSQHYPYPLLPNEPDIRITSLKNDRALINWNMSPSETVTPIEYCIALSSKRHFMDYCQLDIQNKDNDEEYELDLLPSDASTSFAFWWGKTVKKMLRQSKVDSIKDNNLKIECVGKNTFHTILNLKSEVNYFIDVFAKNSITNATSMYRTINITIINSEPINLKESEQTIVRLNATNNYTKLFKYNFNTKSEDNLWLFAQSCSGPGPLTLTIKSCLMSSPNVSQILFSDFIFDMKTIEIIINKSVSQSVSQMITIEVLSRVATERTAVILLSKKHNKFPFPRLPDDRKIKVLETLTDCDSVTLAWTASPDDKVLYCIYQREAHNHQNSPFIQSKNACNDINIYNTNNENYLNDDNNENNSNPTRKVLCRRYHKSSKRRFNNVIMQNVKRLSSGTKYVFQVMLTKYRGRTLAYEQVWVSTKSKYQCQ